MKIGLQITARLKSSRLPFKLLMDLNGYSIIEHVIHRAKMVNGIDEIVLCTSSNSQDNPLVDISCRNNIYYFLGSEIDVLKRAMDCAEFFGFDYIVSITGENPLFSIDHANQMVDLIRRDKIDFGYIEGLPIGCAVYGLNVKALKVVCEVKKEIDTEIWGALINRPEIFKVSSINTQRFYKRPDLRLTTDYFEDYQLMASIFSHFQRQEIPSLYQALQVLDQNPEYCNLNKDKIQAGLDEETTRRIDTFYRENITSIQEIKKAIYNDL